MPSRTAADEPALRRLRVWSRILLAIVGVLVVVITLRPGPPDPDGQSALRAFLANAHQHGLPLWISFELIEFSANVVMFLPIGLFGALAFRRARWLVVPTAALLSIGIEVVQAIALPQRFGTVQDVVANTLGALLGYLLACLIIALVRRWTRRAQERRTGADRQPDHPLTDPAGRPR